MATLVRLPALPCRPYPLAQLETGPHPGSLGLIDWVVHSSFDNLLSERGEKKGEEGHFGILFCLGV